MKFRMILCVLFLAVPVLVFSATGDFTRTLFVGMRGEDVRVLQKVLNTDTDTRIASTGSGSPGFETDYFGPATKRAVAKFQEKYRAEVLTPLGLTAGTGVFGEKTRAKAQMLLSVTSTTPRSVIVATTTGASVAVATSIPIEKGDVFVYFPSRYSGKTGTAVTISGLGLTPTDNTVYFDTTHMVGEISSWNGQEITFKIPVISKGVYHLFVKNARGESNKDMFFVVTDGMTPEPRIESVTPESVTRGEAVAIKGSGFALSGNMVRSSVGVTENISSVDGNSLSFVVPMTVLMASSSPFAPKISLPIWVYVVNENGVSNGKSFELKI